MKEPHVRALSPTGGRPDPAEDAALLQEPQGASQEFAELYDRYAPAIHRYATRRLGAGLADDVVAETFLVAFRRRQRFDPAQGQVRPWLYGIASNLIAAHRRFEVRQYRALAKTAIDPLLTDYHDDVDDRVAATAVARQLAAALSHLSKGDRDVLLLIAWESFSYDEVAQALAIPVGTVRSRLHRARKKVQKTLGGVNPAAVHEEFADG
ncbi:RNA polymerase sigma-70 factor, ECF subfamily [Streptomyces sp. 1222.5]|uniref:RNA polymerase sigma factor n=1 Tax=unclassified Streptomyces TaxID=2593676 RepID=UPI000899E129|nr:MULTISPECIES: RNA polymerase sigma factor [unclassified Streptomyces]PKW12345.1 RNA polymerase sigma-70 factor (ECF subfamily) [Streptomyces sp. 5112.2]SEB57976.1 RNA polymerase sigma-70 factor, ECF subfamily [Streptomyces sp. 1222.5]